MRADLDIIQEWIAPGSRVLDLGCGDGELLAWLREHKQVAGYGLEIDAEKIATCIERGVNVIEQDLDQGLGIIGLKLRIDQYRLSGAADQLG